LSNALPHTHGPCSQKPLFNLLTFDEAHHIKAKTWDEISSQLRAPTVLTGPALPNVLLLTATPFHASGNLDVPAVRDRSLTPCTLLDAIEAQPPITKNVVFLEIGRKEGGQKPPECNMDIIMLVGDLLANKMVLAPAITHRGLVLINKTKQAEVCAQQSRARLFCANHWHV